MGSVDGDAPENTLGRYEQLCNADPIFFAAVEAIDYPTTTALRIRYPDLDVNDFEAVAEVHKSMASLTGDAFVDAAVYLRNHPTTSIDVIAQELHLRKHRPAGAPSGVERVLLSIFRHALLELDGFAKEEADRLAAEEAEANKPDPVPVPIEDTTLETVDGPFDTWR